MKKLAFVFILSLSACSNSQPSNPSGGGVNLPNPSLSSSSNYIRRGKAEFDIASGPDSSNVAKLVRKSQASCVHGQCTDYSDITVNDSTKTQFSLVPSQSQQTISQGTSNQNLTNIVSLQIGTLFDNDLNSCGGQKCTSAFIRIYMTGTTSGVTGLYNAAIGQSVELDVSGGGLSQPTAVPYNPMDTNLIVDTLPLPAQKELISLASGDFSDASSSGAGYTLSANFTQAGAGTYLAHVVVEYDLSGPAIGAGPQMVSMFSAGEQPITLGGINNGLGQYTNNFVIATQTALGCNLYELIDGSFAPTLLGSISCANGGVAATNLNSILSNGVLYTTGGDQVVYVYDLVTSTLSSIPEPYSPGSYQMIVDGNSIALLNYQAGSVAILNNGSFNANSTQPWGSVDSHASFNNNFYIITGNSTSMWAVDPSGNVTTISLNGIRASSDASFVDNNELYVETSDGQDNNGLLYIDSSNIAHTALTSSTSQGVIINPTMVGSLIPNDKPSILSDFRNFYTINSANVAIQLYDFSIDWTTDQINAINGAGGFNNLFGNAGVQMSEQDDPATNTKLINYTFNDSVLGIHINKFYKFDPTAMTVTQILDLSQGSNMILSSYSPAIANQLYFFVIDSNNDPISVSILNADNSISVVGTVPSSIAQGGYFTTYNNLPAFESYDPFGNSNLYLIGANSLTLVIDGVSQSLSGVAGVSLAGNLYVTGNSTSNGLFEVLKYPSTVLDAEYLDYASQSLYSDGLRYLIYYSNDLNFNEQLKYVDSSNNTVGLVNNLVPTNILGSEILMGNQNYFFLMDQTSGLPSLYYLQ